MACLKLKYPDDDEKIEQEWERISPNICKRFAIFTQTFLGFVPGLSWIPLHKKVAESNDNSHRQTLLARKMFELFGEDAPQFILQVRPLK